MISCFRSFRKPFLCMSLKYNSSSKISNKDLYFILNVPRNASQKQIRASYYELSLTLHPDKVPIRDVNDDTHEKFTQLVEAYKILGNVNSRKVYDRTQKVEALVEFDSEVKHQHHLHMASKKHDAWTKSHYDKTVELRNDRIKRHDLLKVNSVNDQEAYLGRQIVFASLFVLFGTIFIRNRCLKYKISNKDTTAVK